MPDQVAEWHARILTGDPEAADALARWLVPRVKAILQAEFRRTDAEIVIDAAEDGVLEYLAAPAKWEPDRAGLLTFVSGIARKKVFNRLRAEGRYQGRNRRYAGGTSPSRPLQQSPIP